MSYDLKERILATVPIEVYIGHYVHLKRSGNSLKGLCPFHKEKSPSFTVSPEKGFFHCFGCGKGGDIFRFVMDQEALSFFEAMDSLARYAGIQTEKHSKKNSSRKQFLAEINTKVAKNYSDFLHGEEGQLYKNYLLKRGLTEESIRHFQLGASPENWSWLAKSYEKQEKDLLELGLLRKKNHDKASYDSFRDRIIFPIISADKQISGFGGRILPGKNNEKRAAKYINSSDSILFKKSQILYGLTQNLNGIRFNQEALIVEGYLDVIGLWQAGIHYACAPLGTSLGDSHLQHLLRYTKFATILFDGDTAGLQAAYRGISLNLQQSNYSISLSVCLLPPGCDPFDISILDTGVQQIKSLLESKINGADFFLMETMLPENFQKIFTEMGFSSKDKEKGSSLGFTDFITLSKQYYTGKIPSSLPQGMEKRKALERLYEALQNFTRDIDRRLLIEASAQILQLNSIELQEEWKQRFAKSSLRYNRKNDVSAYVNDTKNSSLKISADIPKKSVIFGENDQNKSLFSCERNLLVEILFNPSLFEEFYEELKVLHFEDVHSEFLWRHLESRYLLGNIWSQDQSITRLDLLEDTQKAFHTLIIDRQGESKNDTMTRKGVFASSISNRVIRDYLLSHTKLKKEKHINKIEEKISVADPIEKANLIKEMGELIKELEFLKEEMRDKPS